MGKFFAEVESRYYQEGEVGSASGEFLFDDPILARDFQRAQEIFNKVLPAPLRLFREQNERRVANSQRSRQHG